LPSCTHLPAGEVGGRKSKGAVLGPATASVLLVRDGYCICGWFYDSFSLAVLFFTAVVSTEGANQKNAILGIF
jgi:hypothetical protein